MTRPLSPPESPGYYWNGSIAWTGAPSPNDDRIALVIDRRIVRYRDPNVNSW
jgi:hypothetical protein